MTVCFGATKIETNRMQHQSIDSVGEGLVVTGRTADGTVEAIEHSTNRVLGVQWHPERLATIGHQVLFDWLVREAGR